MNFLHDNKEGYLHGYKINEIGVFLNCRMLHNVMPSEDHTPILFLII